MVIVINMYIIDHIYGQGGNTGFTVYLTKKTYRGVTTIVCKYVWKNVRI